MMRGMRGGRHSWALWALIGAPGLGACATTQTVRTTPARIALVTTTEASRCWQVLEGGEPYGWVVRFEGTDGPGHEYYSVRNLHHQELGTLDEQGRAWRFVPHQREAEWVWTGTVLEGTRLILGLGTDAELEEAPLDELRTR